MTLVMQTSTPWHEDHEDEQAPLLARSQSAITTASQHVARRSRASWKIIYGFMFVVLLISFGDQLIESPQARIQEAVICYRYFEVVDPSKINLSRDAVGPGAIGGVDELWCKAGEIQADLVMLRGWQLFFDGIPSIALAVPFGWAADRYGRKPFVLAGLVGITGRGVWIAMVTWFWQHFDIRITWLSTAVSCVGGGVATTSSLLFAALSDITSDDERSSIFLQVGAVNLLANLVMPPIAAWLMAQYTPWIPVLMGASLGLLSIFAFIFTPETLNFASRHQRREPVPKTNTTDSALPAPPDLSPNQEPISLNTSNRLFKSGKEAVSFLLEDWRIPVLVLPFLVYMLLGNSGQLVIQFMSTRFQITFAKSTLVATIRNGMVVVVLFLLLPLLSNFMVHKMHVSPQKKDLTLARFSQVFMAIGWFAFGFAPNVPVAIVTLVIGSLGQGAPFLLRGFLTSLLPQDRIASAYSLITIVDTVGLMLGAPLLAGLMKTGFTLGGFWIGVPFYFTGIFSSVLAVLLFLVGLRKGEGDESGLEEEAT